jgi:aryl-alcohol dehydrogenase-like predicted oxidoreductase
MNLKAKIGLGTVQFGIDYGISNENGKTPKEEVKRILDLAEDEGIDTLDTAIAYGDSENVLGAIGVDKFKIISKFLPEPDYNFSLEDQLKKTLGNLKTESLYGYLAHRPLDLLNNSDQWKLLNMFKDEGVINKIGFSLNEPTELEQLLGKNMTPDLVQVPFNYFDRRFQKAIKELHSEGCEIHTRSAFLQGLFFKDPETLSSHFEEVKKIILELKNSTEYLASTLLCYVLEKPFIDKVIIGVETKDQLLNNLNHLSVANSLSEIKFKISEKILNPSRWPKN